MKTWNYKKPDGYINASQKDWNQTIVSAINETVNYNHLNIPAKINSPLKYIDLFKSLEYYNIDNDTIGNKYYVRYDLDDSCDFILIGNTIELDILNFIVNDIACDSDLETDAIKLNEKQPDSDIEMVINYHIIDRDAKINNFITAIKSNMCSEDYLMKDLKYIISMNNSISVLNKAMDILTYIK